MNNRKAIEALQITRKELLMKKESFLEKINADINSIEASIEMLSGKKVWETEIPVSYDDENPNYIKSSFEE
jgi:hypothetical protein